MMSSLFSTKKVLAVVAFCFLCGTEDSIGKSQISFKDPILDSFVHHEITAAHHKIKIGPIGDPSKTKVITLPLPLKANWKQKVKLEDHVDKGKKNRKFYRPPRNWPRLFPSKPKKNKDRGKKN